MAASKGNAESRGCAEVRMTAWRILSRAGGMQMPRTEGKESGLDRRAFARLAGGGALAACAAELRAESTPTKAPPSPPAPARALMKVGTQHDSSDETLTVLAALGVTHICSRLPSTRLDEKWSVDG